MDRGLRLALAIATLSLAGCQQQTPASVLGPSPASIPSAQTVVTDDSVFGATSQAPHQPADHDSGFTCLLGGTPADQSHATISASGNQMLHCSGQTTIATGGGALLLEGFPCSLHYENAVTTDSRLVVTASGEATLTCHLN